MLQLRSDLVQEDFAAGIFEVHVQFNCRNIVFFDINMFECRDLGNKL